MKNGGNINLLEMRMTNFVQKGVDIDIFKKLGDQTEYKFYSLPNL